MTDYVLPNHSQIPDKVSSVVDKLDRVRLSGGFKRVFTSGKIQRGDAFMDGTRSLIDHCGPMMNKVDQVILGKLYDAAAAAREELDASDVSIVQRFRNARNFERLSKGTYRAVKRASDRALDNSLRGSFGRTTPPAPEGASPLEPLELPLEGRSGTSPPGRTPPATSEELDATDPSAGAPPPVTPEEPDTPPPHDLGTDSYATLSPRAAGIGGPMDEFQETYSFYEQDLAASEISIASYKTDRTVNSRKSRYNALPRRKHADSGHLGITEGIESLNVDDVSVQGSEVPAAGPQPGPSPEPDQSWMADRVQEADNLSRISIEDLTGADDQRRWE